MTRAAGDMPFDLAGDIDVAVSDSWAFDDGPPVLRVEQRLAPGVRYAAWVPVTAEILTDQALADAAVALAVDLHLRPWKRPDANPMPALDLVPTWVRSLQRKARHLHRRTVAALEAFRGPAE